MKQKYKEALLDMAIRFGQTSEAKRLKVGALIVKNGAIISTGCNGQPSGWHTEVCEDAENNTLSTVRHAEKSALDKMRRSTETTVGATMFVSHAPCKSCAIEMVDAGIEEVYYAEDYRSFEGIEYLRSKGVKVERRNECV